MLRALLCELEGVLVETNALRRRAMTRALAAAGARLPDDWRSGVAATPIVPSDAGEAAAAAGLAVDQTRIDLIALDASAAFLDAAGVGSLTLAPGALPLIEDAAVRLRLGIVTRARRREAEVLLARTGLIDAFSFVIAEEDTLLGKPHPEPYLAALDRLAWRRGRADTVLALEHGITGITSAVSAGVRCIAVGPFEYRAGIEAAAEAPALSSLSMELLAQSAAAGSVPS